MVPTVALSVSWGSSWRYLVRHAEEGVSERERGTEDNYYLRASEHGEPPGLWIGRGIELLGLSGEVQRHEMETVFGELKDPRTGEALGSPPRKYATESRRLEQLLAREIDPTPERIAALEVEARKSGREARNLADLTYSPPKSWSVLHASLERAGRNGDADAVWDCWMTGVEASLEFLQRTAGYSRAGYHGAPVAGRSSGRWVDAHSWVTSAWRHHTSRDGDPQIHVHVAVLNRALCDDGVWRTLDSKAIMRARPAAEALAHRVAEQELTRRLGVDFVTRPDGIAREIAGIDAETRELFSSRRRAINSEMAELVEDFTARHGEPNAYQRTLLAETATLKTRARKPDYGPTRQSLLDDWEAKTTARLGKTLAGVLETVEMDTEKVRPVAVDYGVVITQALAQVDRSKAAWTRYDLMAQLDRYLPDDIGGLNADASERLLQQLADQALAPGGATLCLTAPEIVAAPKQLRRDDGCSIYEPYGADRYATVSLLNQEERLAAMAHTTGGRRLGLERAAALTGASELAGDQAEAAKAILSSSRRVEVLVGPAGTGKSFTMGEIARIWEDEGGKVLGITVAQDAAQVLGDEGISRAVNLSRFLLIQDRIAEGKASRAERRDYTLTQASLVILDEASMMPTPELARVIELAHGAGGKVLVTGDGRQLQAVGGPGGGMNLLIRELGAHELAEVRRFEAEWEGPASLRLREGDSSVLAEYDRRARFVDGTDEEVDEAAYLGFMADYLDGKSTLLVTSTNERAAELASTVRADLAYMGRVEERGVELHNHTVAGRGDLIQTRRNDRRIADPNRRSVVNRDVYEVTARMADGSLRVRRQQGSPQELGPEMTLPAHYVREHVELAYARTAHAAQGRTVDTCHAVVDEGMDRAALYVALTRGRSNNAAYVVTRHDAEEFTEDFEQDHMAVLASILERQDTELTATEVMADELAASESLARLGPVWADCLAEDASQRYQDVLARVLGPERAEQVRADDASGPLWRLIRGAELDGHRPAELLERVVGQRELETAESIAQVLHYRIAQDLGPATSRPEPSRGSELPFVLRSFIERTPAPESLEFSATQTLHEARASYARGLAVVMDARVVELGDKVAQERPVWADQLGPMPEDPAERVEWTERAGAVAAYREQYHHDSPGDPIGVAPSRGGDPDRRAAWEQAWTALGRPGRNRDVARLSEGELHNHVLAYEREEAWAPPYPGGELRQAHEAARYWSRQATFDQVKLRSDFWRKWVGRDKVRSDHEEGDSAGVLARHFAKVAGQLEEVAGARAAWHDHTEEKRELARRASEELDRRNRGQTRVSGDGHDQAPAPQHADRQAAVGNDLSRALAQARTAHQIITERSREAELASRLDGDYVRQHRDADELGIGISIDISSSF